MVIILLGERLKEVRINNNLTQTDIANKFNVTTATVSAWEKDKAKPDYNILKGFAEEFNVSADYLLGINNKEFERFRNLLKEAGNI